MLIASGFSFQVVSLIRVSNEGSGYAAASKGGVRKGFWPGTVLDLICSNENSASLSTVAVNTLVFVPAMLHAIVDHVRESFRR